MRRDLHLTSALWGFSSALLFLAARERHEVGALYAALICLAVSLGCALLAFQVKNGERE